MRQGQAFVLSALLLLCVGAAAAARQGNPANVGGTSREAGGAGLAGAGQGGVAHERASGSDRPDQGHASNVGGTAATAAGPASTSASAAASTGTGTGAPAKHKSHAAKCTYRGTVASVDATAKSFVVHPAKGDDVTLKVNDKTTYSPKGKGWDDVKADAKVSGTCKKDGADSWAVSVRFAPAPKAKAEPAGKSGNPGDIGGPPAKTGAR